MAIYRNIHLTFWSDTKIVDEFTPEDKYFYLYLMTNTHTNLCGCYEVSIKQMSREMGYTQDSVESLIKRFSEVHNVIRYDFQRKEILLLNWSKYNWTKSAKFTSALEKEIESVKSTEFKEFLKNKLYRIDTVFSIDGYPMHTTVTDTVTDKELKEIIKRIIDYLNNKCNTKYKPNTANTKKHIHARLEEGYSEQDFYTVIDKKAKEWIGTEYEKFLRPDTLFCSKFESYLNQNIREKKDGNMFNNFQQNTYDFDELEKELMGN